MPAGIMVTGQMKTAGRTIRNNGNACRNYGNGSNENCRENIQKQPKCLQELREQVK
jgi:hypothetical protein